MVTIADIIKEIERYAPPALQEEYDNAGVQVGDIFCRATGVLLCLDVTESVVTEAVERGCNLIVSHHPLLFKPVKRLSGTSYIERCVMAACKHDLVIYAAHTNLDNVWNGVNCRLARMIGLRDARILSPKTDALLKLVTFVPSAHAHQIRNILFDAGAGSTGNYDLCSFNLQGSGTFRANQQATPFCGQPEEFHTEPEVRIETILPTYKKDAVVRALLAAHPYEEPVFDFYFLDNVWPQAGAGIIGELPQEETEPAFLQRVKRIFGVENLRHSAFTGRPVRKVALCGGSGAFMMQEAIAGQADVFITGEARYNDFFDAQDRILLAIVGHYESEICTKEIFYDLLSEKFPSFAVFKSWSDNNPVNCM